MKVEIDTSSRLDKSGGTVFAFSNGQSKTAMLNQKDRNDILAILPGRKLFTEIKIFCACIFILLEKHLQDIEKITIDAEYPGYEDRIRWLLLNMIKKSFKTADIEISFRSIGRKSRAHQLSYGALKKFIKTDFVIDKKMVLGVLKRR